MKNWFKHINTKAIEATIDNSADDWTISEAEATIERNADHLLNTIRADRFDRECEEGEDW